MHYKAFHQNPNCNLAYRTVPIICSLGKGAFWRKQVTEIPGWLRLPMVRTYSPCLRTEHGNEIIDRYRFQRSINVGTVERTRIALVCCYLLPSRRTRPITSCQHLQHNAITRNLRVRWKTSTFYIEVRNWLRHLSQHKLMQNSVEFILAPARFQSSAFIVSGSTMYEFWTSN